MESKFSLGTYWLDTVSLWVGHCSKKLLNYQFTNSLLQDIEKIYEMKLLQLC